MLDIVDFPLVTVITVTYNSGNYVKDTISGVLQQDYPSIEYIIGDDCSSDNTWAVINEFQDPRIKAYRNSENLKEYNNRNKALNKASGKYLIFVDGDDIIYPHAIRTFVYYLEKFPKACMAIQKGYFNNVIFPILLEPRESYINYFFGEQNLMMSSFASNFFRTDLLQSYQLSTEYLSGDDEVRLRLAANFPILYIPGWLTWPRETPGQASSKITEELDIIQKTNYVRAILKNKNQISGDNELSTLIEMKLNDRAIKSLRNSLMRGKIKRFISFRKRLGIRWLNLITKHPSRPPQDVLSLSSPTNPLSCKMGDAKK